ncbi:MAG TPA: thiamine ABC transporter substrate-binding protein [Acidimicrobiia bacterium]|nr:thiamine ABC transporter substrate-binding protein [Acidimicrobiia bacterium]
MNLSSHRNRLRNLAITVGALILASAALVACSDGADGRTITLVTHDSFAVARADLQAFERAHDVDVQILRAGDGGTALNQVILTKDAPIGDVMFGVDNTFLTRATDADVFAPYESPELVDVADEYQLDPTHALTPIDTGDVCVDFDRTGLAEAGVEPPTSLEDLTRPIYRGMLVAENPATSSPGLAFLLATIAEYHDGWGDYWQRLRDNDVRVVDGWEQAYFSEFSGGGEAGTRPLVVSYASSPPAAVLDVEPIPATAPTAAVLTTCFRQVEFAGVLQGTEHPRLARDLVDWMLGEQFQEGVTQEMFVYPVRADVPIPEVFERLAPLPEDPFELSPTEIGEHRDDWIDEWTDIVLR